MRKWPVKARWSGLAASRPRLNLRGDKARRVWTCHAGSALLSPRPYRDANAHAIGFMTIY